jgi:hypothetical protein
MFFRSSRELEIELSVIDTIKPRYHHRNLGYLSEQRAACPWLGSTVVGSLRACSDVVVSVSPAG